LRTPSRSSPFNQALALPRLMLDCAVSVAFYSRASDIGFTIGPVRTESTCWRSGTLNAGVARP